MTAPDRLAQTLNNTLAKRGRPHMTKRFWHLGMPPAVIAYALLKREPP
jgi:hypothetical protein